MTPLSRPIFLPRLLALALLACWPATAAAQAPRVAIRDVSIGLPPGRFVSEREDSQQPSAVLKRNAWAPISLQLEVLQEFPPSFEASRQNLQLLVESSDGDGLRTSVTYPLGGLAGRKVGERIATAELPAVPHVRVGDSAGAGVTLTVLSEEITGGPGRPLSDPFRVEFLRTRDPGSYVVLGLGSNLPGFDLPRDDQPNAPEGQRGGLRGGRVETAGYGSVRDLPDQWFGYGAADLIVLPTGAGGGLFARELFGPGDGAKTRRAALLEWVRRGGKLLVSAGSNAGALSQLPALNDVLPTKLPAGGPTKNLLELPLRWQVFGGRPQNEVLRSRADPFAVAKLDAIPARAKVLIPQPEERDRLDPELAELPIAVQAPYGLGRVTLVAFDLDRPPFTEFAPRPAFWDWLLRTAGAERASAATAETAVGGGREDELAADLRAQLDQFEGVPVISFGWVALFIALYALLIGPVEYLFLKKVVGRLELTWITFPLIVAAVSAGAYLTAYAVKGKDLRINKIDLADVDPASGRVYGRSWFALFSPRIDRYTVGVQPREGWSAGGRTSGPALVDWLGGSPGGAGNILSRGYGYHTRPSAGTVADGLVDVPIQVWSTKAFTASWSAGLDPAAPLVESRLYHPPGDPDALAGSFVNRLPVGELRDAVLVYAGRATKLGTLVPGQQVTPVRDASTDDPDWFARSARVDALARPNPGGTGGTAAVPLWGALFHERALSREFPSLFNGSLRDLDQSWRTADRAETAYRGEAVLLARIEASTTGTGQGSEELMADPLGASVSKLWLNALPSGTEPRRPVPGSLRQETYIRAYLPVAGRRP